MYIDNPWNNRTDKEAAHVDKQWTLSSEHHQWRWINWPDRWIPAHPQQSDFWLHQRSLEHGASLRQPRWADAMVPQAPQEPGLPVRVHGEPWVHSGVSQAFRGRVGKDQGWGIARQYWIHIKCGRRVATAITDHGWGSVRTLEGEVFGLIAGCWCISLLLFIGI